MICSIFHSDLCTSRIKNLLFLGTGKMFKIKCHSVEIFTFVIIKLTWFWEDEPVERRPLRSKFEAKLILIYFSTSSF